MIYPVLMVSTVFNAIVFSLIGVFVYLKNPNNRINQSFCIWSIFMFIWAFGYFFPFVKDSKELSLLSFRMLHSGSNFIPISFLYFVSSVLGIYPEQKKIIKTGAFIHIILAFIVPTPLFIKDMVPKFEMFYWAEINFMYSVWLIIWMSIVNYSVYLLYIGYKKAVGIKKIQIKYILIGAIFTFSCGSTNFFLFYDINILPYLNILSSLYALTTAYAIIRYRFMDIYLTISNTFKIIVAFALSSLLSTLLYFLLTNFHAPILFILLLVFCCAILTYSKFLYFLKSSFFHRLFRTTSFENLKLIIDNFKNKNTFYASVQDLEKKVKKVFCTEFKIESIKIILLNNQNNLHLKKLFNKKKDFLVTKEEEHFGKDKKKPQYLQELKDLGEVCFPLYQGPKRLIGLFVLGKKPFDDLYKKEELELFEGLSHYIALSLMGILYNSELKKEVKEKTQSLITQNKKVKDLLKQQEELVAVSAHELRTPLNVALLQAELFSVDTAVPENKERIFSLKEALNRLLELVQKFFDSQKYELDKSSLVLKKTYLAEFISNMCESLSPLMQEKKIAFTFNNQIDENTTVIIDQTNIRQVVNNILSNSIKFLTEKVKRNRKITLNLQEDQDHVYLKTEDNGPGIPDHSKKQVFEKFKGDPMLKNKGIGLGLYICKKIINLHKGKIWIEDAPKKGTVICIKLNKA